MASGLGKTYTLLSAVHATKREEQLCSKAGPSTGLGTAVTAVTARGARASCNFSRGVLLCAPWVRTAWAQAFKAVLSSVTMLRTPVRVLGTPVLQLCCIAVNFGSALAWAVFRCCTGLCSGRTATLVDLASTANTIVCAATVFQGMLCVSRYEIGVSTFWELHQ